jgi:hypothetical protein
MNKYDKLINRVMSIHAQSDTIHGGSQITEIQQDILMPDRPCNPGDGSRQGLQ